MNPAVLEVRGLKRHFGKFPAVDGVDLNVISGQIYGFLGINGAGKTTTIRSIMGIIAPEAGTIRLVGETTRRTSVAQKRRIGYVSQEQNFYPWMNCRNLGKFVGSFYPTWDAPEFSRLLELFSIPPDRKVSALSGGMKAKLALALAVAPRPELLILDEPTAGLDPVARSEFMEIIVAQSRQHQRTTFFSSHLIDEVERCADRIGIIHAGKMRFEGQLDELRDQVRCLSYPVEMAWEMPAHFESWRKREVEGMMQHTLRGAPEQWDSLELPEPVKQRRLTLEEIFIACVSAERILL
jgi:ABC-2 type transport system ATP-binding protein